MKRAAAFLPALLPPTAARAACPASEARASGFAGVREWCGPAAVENMDFAGCEFESAAAAIDNRHHARAFQTS